MGQVPFAEMVPGLEMTTVLTTVFGS